jgi:hypothetical protein
MVEENVPDECNPLFVESDKEYREADQGNDRDSYSDGLPVELAKVAGGGRQRRLSISKPTVH